MDPARDTGHEHTLSENPVRYEPAFWHLVREERRVPVIPKPEFRLDVLGEGAAAPDDLGVDQGLPCHRVPL